MNEAGPAMALLSGGPGVLHAEGGLLLAILFFGLILWLAVKSFKAKANLHDLPETRNRRVTTSAPTSTGYLDPPPVSEAASPDTDRASAGLLRSNASADDRRPALKTEPLPAAPGPRPLATPRSSTGLVTLRVELSPPSLSGGVGTAPFEPDSMPPSVAPPSTKDFARAADAMPARWLPKGHPITVAGYSLPDGLVYVGDSLHSVSGYAQEPALIQPSSPVFRSSPNRSGEGIGYWPSYGSILAAGRAAYLEWISTGRKDPQAYIGYVFLFFYGLERRVLHDLAKDPRSRDELPSIREEVERLQGIYTNNGSFQGFASCFLGVCRALENATDSVARQPPSGFSKTWEIPLDVKLALGRFAREGKPIPAEWAFAWAWNDPETSLRTPAERCPDEVRELFLARYQAAYPEGLVLKPNKTCLVVKYRPASASFANHGDFTLPLDDVPDVTAQRSVASRLRTLLEQCVSEIDPYSRWLGRATEGAPVLPGLALLPAEVLATRDRGDAKNLRDWLNLQFAGGDSCLISGAELLAKWPLGNPTRPTKSEIVGMTQFLQKLGCGVEPDVRFGGPVPDPGRQLVLFRLPENSPTAPSPEYAAASLLLNLGASIAGADDVSREEELLLQRHLESSLNLGPAERVRMAAHLRWLLTTPPGLNSLKKRLEQLPPGQRTAVADFLVAVAGADGRITKNEVTALTKSFSLLGLDPAEVYGRIHAFTASVPSSAMSSTPLEPVTVQPSSAKSGFRIPSPAEKDDPPQVFALDMRRVDAKIAESIAVSSLLSQIFAEQEEPTPPPPMAEPEGSTLIGLDASHSAALRELLLRQVWSRAEWESLCQQHHLLPDGAIETINDAVFECHDSALIEGEDPFEVNQEVAKEIQA